MRSEVGCSKMEQCLFFGDKKHKKQKVKKRKNREKEKTGNGKE